MGRTSIGDRAVDSIREPLLDKTSEDEDVNREISDPIGAEEGTGLTILGSHHSFYAPGQWIWLYLAWSTMRSFLSIIRNRGFYVFAGIFGFILILTVHGFFLIELSRSPGRNPSRLAQVNNETLPAVLSGLRVFGLMGGDDSAIHFFLTVAAIFLLFEVFEGFWCYEYIKSRPSNQDDRILNNMEAGFDSRIISMRLLCEHSAKMQRSWSAIEHWAWILFMWIGYRDPSHAPGFIWLVSMFGHGILYAVPFVCHGRSPTLSRLNRENLPLMLSACLVFSLEDDSADQFLVTTATCFLLTQIVGNACRRFHASFLTKVFAKFDKMENNYFESLKESEAEEAAQLEKQIERMSYFESLPRSNLSKGRRKRLMLVFYLLLALYGTKTLFEQGNLAELFLPHMKQHWIDGNDRGTLSSRRSKIHEDIPIWIRSGQNKSTKEIEKDLSYRD